MKEEDRILMLKVEQATQEEQLEQIVQECPTLGFKVTNQQQGQM